LTCRTARFADQEVGDPSPCLFCHFLTSALGIRTGGREPTHFYPVARDHADALGSCTFGLEDELHRPFGRRRSRSRRGGVEIHRTKCKGAMTRRNGVRTRPRARDLASDDFSYYYQTSAEARGVVLVGPDRSSPAVSCAPKRNLNPHPSTPAGFVNNDRIQVILLATLGYMNDSRCDAEWLSQKAEHGESSPRRICKASKQPAAGLRGWRGWALLVGLVVALAWTLKLAMGL